MTFRDTFTRLASDLNKLNPNELTIVTYQPKDHTLAFRQIGVIFIASYLSPYYLPKKGFRVGILNQRGLQKLKYQLAELLKNELIDTLMLIPDLEELSTGWYRTFDRNEPVPMRVFVMKYCNITSKFWTWITCRLFNTNSKVLYKIATAEIKSENSKK